jgi:hypothetical protein
MFAFLTRLLLMVRSGMPAYQRVRRGAVKCHQHRLRKNRVTLSAFERFSVPLPSSRFGKAPEGGSDGRGKSLKSSAGARETRVT